MDNTKTNAVEMLVAPRQFSDVEEALEEVKQNKFIGQVTPEEIQKYIKNDTIRFFYEDGIFMGFGAWQKISKEWREIGPVYIMERAREKGVARQIVDEMFAINAPYHLYLISKNPVIFHMANRYKFQQVATSKLPTPIKLYLLKKISPRRIVSLITKYSADPAKHFIRPVQGVSGAGRGG
jgi:hypothetical protein